MDAANPKPEGDDAIDEVDDTSRREQLRAMKDDPQREARWEKWRQDNAEAIAAWNDWYETNGHPLAEFMIMPGQIPPQ